MDQTATDFEMIRGEKLPDYASKIPPVTLHALVQYALRGGATGHFLTAFLSNDLQGAMDHADDENLAAFRELNWLIFNKLPMGCHGNREKVKAWRAQGGIVGAGN